MIGEGDVGLVEDITDGVAVGVGLRNKEEDLHE